MSHYYAGFHLSFPLWVCIGDWQLMFENIKYYYYIISSIIIIIIIIIIKNGWQFKAGRDD